jgi:hypothetical protein
MTIPLKTLVFALIAVFAPAKGIVLTSFALVLIDLVTGIWAAKKRGEPITSQGLRRTLTKLAVYESALLIAFLAEQYLISDLLPVSKIVSSYIGVVELKSVLENVNDIGGNDLLKALINKLNGPND